MATSSGNWWSTITSAVSEVSATVGEVWSDIASVVAPEAAGSAADGESNREVSSAHVSVVCFVLLAFICSPSCLSAIQWLRCRPALTPRLRGARRRRTGAPTRIAAASGHPAHHHRCLVGTLAAAAMAAASCSSSSNSGLQLMHSRNNHLSMNSNKNPRMSSSSNHIISLSSNSSSSNSIPDPRTLRPQLWFNSRGVHPA